MESLMSNCPSGQHLQAACSCSCSQDRLNQFSQTAQYIH